MVHWALVHEEISELEVLHNYVLGPKALDVFEDSVVLCLPDNIQLKFNFP